MPQQLLPQTIIVNTGGTVTLSTLPSTNYYIVQGTSTLASGYQISPASTTTNGLFFKIKYQAQVTYSGSNVVTIFGVALTQAQALSELDIECYFNGSVWDVNILVCSESIPNNYQGVETTTVPSIGGTVTLVAGANKIYQRFNGTVTLSSSYTITADPASEGDVFTIDWNCVCTTGVNTVTIFGIVLDSLQALSGNIVVSAVYDGSQWVAELLTGELKINSVTNDMLAQMSALTLKGNNTNSTANSTDIPIASLTPTGTITITSAGGSTNIPVGNLLHQKWVINASGSLVAPYTISPTGTPTAGSTVDFYFTGGLAWGGSSPQTFTVFGTVININVSAYTNTIRCVYNGSAWIVCPVRNQKDVVHTVNLIASFEADEQGVIQVKIPYIGKITAYRAVVNKTIAGTDDGTIEFKTATSFGGASSPLSGPYTITQSSGVGSVFFDIATYTPAGFTGDGAFYLEIITSKTTAGGRVYLSMDITEI